MGVRFLGLESQGGGRPGFVWSNDCEVMPFERLRVPLFHVEDPRAYSKPIPFYPVFGLDGFCCFNLMAQKLHPVPASPALCGPSTGDLFVLLPGAWEMNRDNGHILPRAHRSFSDRCSLRLRCCGHPVYGPDCSGGPLRDHTRESRASFRASGASGHCCCLAIDPDERHRGGSAGD